MDICGDGHEEIVYDTLKCPLCETLDEMEELEKTITNLQVEIEVLEDRLNEIS